MKINGKTALYGILGNPVTHSLSPAMHNAAFAALGINGVYIPMEVKDIQSGLHGLKTLGFKGVSVTVPHKVDVMAFLDEIDPVAEKIGAVNTIQLKSTGENKQILTKGYNTDWLGSNLALADAIELSGTTVLVLGAGGAAKAVGFGLIKAGARVIITNRTVAKGRELARWLECDFMPQDQLNQIQADVLVNTTSVGMEPNQDAIPVTPDLLNRFKVVMDIVYAPLETTLLREAKNRGCRVINGLAMLQYQGIEQFKLWTDTTPPSDIMYKALVDELKLLKQ